MSKKTKKNAVGDLSAADIDAYVKRQFDKADPDESPGYLLGSLADEYLDYADDDQADADIGELIDR